jgi:hypothetical protein
MKRLIIVISYILLSFGSSRADDALDEVNAARASRGLRPFVRDESLSQAAAACANFRASYLMFGHTCNDFAFLPPGASASATGCSAYPASLGWLSCCTFEGYTYAGAAFTVGVDGKRYMSLFVRGECQTPQMAGGDVSTYYSRRPALRLRRR